jgi:dTDP-3-amino-2,3,6-trideoxy-4-keto-D-glucose/dTDP-3-amino-3,4,6-trideoxy-alpha-D-glucose/dTDP-2,6-dideoxy-D-kanosamine transaminase
MIDFWSYKKEYKILRKEILSSIDKTFSNGVIFFGKNLIKFENNFTKKYKSKYGLAVKSGTDALLISLMAIGIKRGDQVITASNTAIPTISAIINSGAIPVLVDINNDYLMDHTKILKAINSKTKAIIPVHLYGKSCNMTEILRIIKNKNIHIIEDCAQAQGSMFKNKFVGTFGSFGCFSFYPTKILGGYGDGGFILTNSYKLFNLAKKIRFYGIETVNKDDKLYGKYYANINGLNSRLDEINAKILDIKLKKINKFISRRREIAKIYNDNLKNTSLTLPKNILKSNHVYHLYTVSHKDRDFIIDKLYKKKIGTKVIYPYPIHKMKAYKKIFNRKKFINSEIFSKKIFSLPIYPELTNKQIFKIIYELKLILKSL